MSYSNFNQVLNALDEGIFNGIILTLKYKNPRISKNKLMEEISKILWQCDQEKLDYWFDWFGLNK